ncbi:2-oxo acid dehydrogenase subunit E2 [Capnocytophaga sp. CM59]|uniref:2-oxo acid dehydrogenase subunit E2 n=1 Tax=Capnocytophaga sp. CM59 TaxID=936370 RepID=UPI00027C6059|nr:2-oxoacid dehydrogenase acyltransferase, catalytic domain protein [Capnocytophaga sp. CM59]
MARYELKLPQMGESVEEAIVSSWLKNVGDTIKVDDILVEVATDKVDSEIPSEVSGVIKEILTPVKSVVKVGQVMAIIETEQEDEIQVELLSETPQPILPIEEIPSQPIELELPPQPTVAAPAVPPIQEVPALPTEEVAAPIVPPIQEVPATPTEEVLAPPTEKEPVLPQEEETVAAQVPYVPQTPVVLPETSQEETNEPFYSPLVKTIAKEENISMDELAAIEGSGIDGRVTKHDLLRYLERRNKTATTPVSVVASTPTPTASAPTPVSEPTVATTEATSLALPTTTELTTQITDVALIDNKLGGSPFSVAAVAESQPAPVAESQSAPVVESQPAPVAVESQPADGLSAIELLMQQKEAAKKDSQEPTPAPVVAQEEAPTPVVAQQEAPAPVVAQEEAPAPVVAQEEVPAPVVAQEEVPAPVVAQEEVPAPVVAQEEAPAPAAQQEKTEVQEVKYPDISDFIKNFEATHPKETPVAEKPVTEETPEKQPQPITIEPTPITLEVPQDKPEEKPVVASTTYTPSPVDKNVEVIEMTRMGKLIANYMIESKRVSAHATSFIEVDVTRIWNWRNKHKKAFESREGEKLTFTPIFIEAVAKALRDFPLMNISTDGERIFKKKQINIGMATALPNGDLIVPVIKNADQLSLVGLAKNVNDLAKRARENKLKPDEVKEGTYTVTNIGAFGNLFGTPILNQPQVGILAIGAIQKVPAVVETPEGDVIAIRYKLMLSHSFDHRVVNGALGGMFVQRVAKYLEQWDVNREI